MPETNTVINILMGVVGASGIFGWTYKWWDSRRAAKEALEAKNSEIDHQAVADENKITTTGAIEIASKAFDFMTQKSVAMEQSFKEKEGLITLQLERVENDYREMLKSRVDHVRDYEAKLRQMGEEMYKSHQECTAKLHSLEIYVRDEINAAKTEVIRTHTEYEKRLEEILNQVTRNRRKDDDGESRNRTVSEPVGGTDHEVSLRVTGNISDVVVSEAGSKDGHSGGVLPLSEEGQSG
jgi:hypothetical protein